MEATVEYGQKQQGGILMSRKDSFFASVCALAIPVALQSMLQASFSIIDQIMIGQLGSVSVAGVGLAGKFSSVFSVLASAIGAPTNPSKIANTFASERQMTYTNKTVSAHIDCLADAFLISKASRYDIKGRKYIGANLKYYFTDLGLRNARLNFRQQEPTHMMENVVYNELLIRGYNVDVGVVEIFDKDKEGKRVRKQLEVDFVVNRGNQRYYIQVAYDMTSEEKQTQEFNSLRNIPDSFKKIVIVNGTKKPWRNDEGFVIMGMKYFLLHVDSLEL